MMKRLKIGAMLLGSLLFGAVAAQIASGRELDADKPVPIPAETAQEDAPPAVEQLEAASRRDALLAGVTIFVLSIFVGFEVIAKVPPTLHTPLMSGSNAISGITIVGAIFAAGAGQGMAAALIGLFALVLAAVNVVGGFLVTHRMLAMFQKK